MPNSKLDGTNAVDVSLDVPTNSSLNKVYVVFS